MRFQSNPKSAATITRKSSNSIQLLKIPSRRRSRIAAILNRIKLIHKQRNRLINFHRPIIEQTGSTPPQFTLKEIKMEILILHIPSNHLPSVLRHDRIESPTGGTVEISHREQFQPALLVLWVVPKDIVAANGDVVVAGELNHGVGNGVIDMAGRLLGAVPFHFVLERGGGEAGEKPVLVGGIVENVAVDGAADWET